MLSYTFSAGRTGISFLEPRRNASFVKTMLAFQFVPLLLFARSFFSLGLDLLTNRTLSHSTHNLELTNLLTSRCSQISLTR